MRVLYVLVASLLLPGCLGLAVGTYGTFESERERFSLTDRRNKFGYRLSDEVITEERLIDLWGAPSKVSTLGSCDVLTYYHGFNWSGVGAFVIAVPIPLLVPTGRSENRFYFRDGEAVGVVRQHGEVAAIYGQMCGSDQCSKLSGPVNSNYPRKVDVSWCD